MRPHEWLKSGKKSLTIYHIELSGFWQVWNWSLMTRLRLWHTPSATYMVCIQISGYGWKRVARVWKTHLCSIPTQIKRFTREGQKIKSSAIESVVLKLQVERKRKNRWCNTDLWQTRNKPGVHIGKKIKNVSESPMMIKRGQKQPLSRGLNLANLVIFWPNLVC